MDENQGLHDENNLQTENPEILQENTPVSNLQTENLPIIVDENIVQTEIAESLQPNALAKKVKTPKAAKQIVVNTPEPNKKRGAITANFSVDEENHLNPIIAARVKHKLSRNSGHFLRQAVDIAINADYIVMNGKQYTFATSENGDLVKMALKDAFFSTQQTQLPTFK